MNVIAGSTKLIIDINNSYFNGSIDTKYSNFGSSNAFVGNADKSSALYNHIFGSKIVDTYVNVSLTKNGTASTIKSLSGNTPFSSFNYVPGVNNGLPAPSGLFWIGGMGGQDVLGCLKAQGFVSIS